MLLITRKRSQYLNPKYFGKTAMMYIIDTTSFYILRFRLASQFIMLNVFQKMALLVLFEKEPPVLYKIRAV